MDNENLTRAMEIAGVQHVVMIDREQVKQARELAASLCYYYDKFIEKVKETT